MDTFTKYEPGGEIGITRHVLLTLPAVGGNHRQRTIDRHVGVMGT